MATYGTGGTSGGGTGNGSGMASAPGGGSGGNIVLTTETTTNTLVTTIGQLLPRIDEPALTPILTNVTVTQGYFSNGAGLLQGSNIHTGTLADSNENYYFNVSNTHPLSSSAENQFSVAFGHKGGSGSVVLSGNEAPTLRGETEAIYKQFASLLLPENEISGGFKISQQGSEGALASGTPDDFIYVLITNRERYKDKLDNKSWTIKLKGRDSQGKETQIISLTDDSDSSTQTTTTGTIVGPRYNIVSGAAGTVVSASSERTFGHFYPHMGVMVFSGAELSASIPGPSGSALPTTSMTASFSANADDGLRISSSGFAPNLFDDGNPKNALRFVNCLANIGSDDIRLRSSQEQQKVSYFCTVTTNQANFSTNPTFTSGSAGKLRHTSMYSNPNVYITGIGLHDTSGQLVAVAKLSTPIQKNFGSQHTIKVNLTY